MSTPSTVRLRILDNDYQVACPPEEKDSLLQAANYLDEKMRAIRSAGNVIGTERIAVLVGLNVVHDLLQQNGQNLGDGRELQRLTDKITLALGSQSQLEL
ncbi:MAG: cell division protein ZapA [Pseudomonadales bacterium]